MDLETSFYWKNNHTAKINQVKIKNFNPDLLYARNLYFFISELINNNLQYAISISLWEFDSNNNEFVIKLTSKIQKVDF
ncbi:MAG: hypothetical protein JJT78_07175 [Leptospira sp.]|nr:hypothetical protein [Leptospira sp.]